MTYLLLQIVYPDGSLWRFPAGGVLEMDLENEIAKRLTTKSVGFFKTTTNVEKAFREAFKEVMFEFKDKVANPR